MRQILALLLLMAAIVTPVRAQLLWRVSGNGAKADSYILGTHHLAPAHFIDSIRGLDRVIASADLVAGEIDMSVMTDPAFQGRMMQAVTAPADSTLSRVLGPERLDSLNSMLSSMTGGQLSAAMFEGMRPAMLSTTLTMMMTASQVPGFDPDMQIDHEMQRRARAAGKDVLGFETADMQMKLLYGSPISVQAEDLMSVVRDPEGATRAALDMSRHYMAGALDSLMSMMEQPVFGISPEMRDAMLYDRNADWNRQLSLLLPARSVFVVVGAGHLPGPRGLLQLLRDCGYTVTPYAGEEL